MEKFITKTAPQALEEKIKWQKESTCPSCGKHCIGTVTTKIGGFFSKTQKRNNYSCFVCGTEWNTGWR